MDWKPYITADPEVMHGAVCLRVSDTGFRGPRQSRCRRDCGRILDQSPLSSLSTFLQPLPTLRISLASALCRFPP